MPPLKPDIRAAWAAVCEWIEPDERTMVVIAILAAGHAIASAILQVDHRIRSATGTSDPRDPPA